MRVQPVKSCVVGTHMRCGGDAHAPCAYAPQVVGGTHISPSLYTLSYLLSSYLPLRYRGWVTGSSLGVMPFASWLAGGAWEVIAADAVTCVAPHAGAWIETRRSP